MQHKPTALQSFPLFSAAIDNGRLSWQNGNSSIREVMLNILLTRPGERLMRPEFGAGILNFIHYPNNETTRALIVDAAERALTRWEPRVILEEVSLNSDAQVFSHANLTVRYRLRNDGSVGHFNLALVLGA